jgi:hypothetical protein
LNFVGTLGKGVSHIDPLFQSSGLALASHMMGHGSTGETPMVGRSSICSFQ